MQDGKEVRDRPIVFGAQDKLPELTLQELSVMQEQAERQAALDRERKDKEAAEEVKMKALEERKKSPHYHAYKHPQNFKLHLHGSHGFKILKGKKVKEDAQSAATALEDDIEFKKRGQDQVGPSSYLTLSRGPSSFHRSVREEDSFGVHDLSPKEEKSK